jgi:AP-3 complex subunit mu
MIHSLFIINEQGDIIIERHWRGRVSRTVGEKFWEEVQKYENRSDVLPIIQTPQYYLVNVYRSGLFFVAVVQRETAPLMVTEFLDRMVEIFQKYIKVVSDESIKRHFTTIYQLLDEMLDYGFPLTTEPNLLNDLVKPIGGSLTQAQVKKNPHDPTGSVKSPIEWRKLGITYKNNEIFFDVIEELSFLIDVNGMSVSNEINGRIECTCRLSGMPDILLQFKDPTLLDDTSFHPCVRYARFEQDRAISFIPPDGKFELLTYRISKVPMPPIYCRPQINFSLSGGTITIMTSSKHGDDKALEEVKIIVPLPKQVQNVKSNVTSGFASFNPNTKELIWNVGRMTSKTSPSLKGDLILEQNSVIPDTTPAVLLKFKLPFIAYSGLKIDSVNLLNERYKPYKGVRYVTVAGKCQVRTC